MRRSTVRSGTTAAAQPVSSIVLSASARAAVLWYVAVYLDGEIIGGASARGMRTYDGRID